MSQMIISLNIAYDENTKLSIENRLREFMLDIEEIEYPTLVVTHSDGRVFSAEPVDDTYTEWTMSQLGLTDEVA